MNTTMIQKGIFVMFMFTILAAVAALIYGLCELVSAFLPTGA